MIEGHSSDIPGSQAYSHLIPLQTKKNHKTIQKPKTIQNKKATAEPHSTPQQQYQPGPYNIQPTYSKWTQSNLPYYTLYTLDTQHPCSVGSPPPEHIIRERHASAHRHFRLAHFLQVPASFARPVQEGGFLCNCKPRGRKVDRCRVFTLRVSLYISLAAFHDCIVCHLSCLVFKI